MHRGWRGYRAGCPLCRESVRVMDRTYDHEVVLRTATGSNIDQNLATSVRVWIGHRPFFGGPSVCKGGNKDRTYVRISRGPNLPLISAILSSVAQIKSLVILTFYSVLLR
ncbi:hypothetical protein FIBSPDRAFT_535017 [Athelia psychrophila]|uniref:Uncharacterized protein n=1 Tax=Athelia psychrophila TaxID=1759441 RepID=A0A166J3P6_9AGAM|nr:hypothetical protein FIBSPDRAFT_535017 [Fibularhizoctonia sp. CBS 109695]